ncbi:hypothetical protein SGCOL_003768 [Colletotrichum sp. CLE4]
MAAPKSKAHPLNGMHTAGIFADPTVDGPLIGTLVAIVDRAKNLPNRKTIGKQDPYCAARLGKEAKRTTTDIRGGQTPRWDQELRFAVHDSPDYYQLKVSVFHDDKKTDLIGETWIDLRDIIVPGGGQNDIWRNLAFKGKYAGEVRMEITYYDQRPKPEKPVAKPRPVDAEPTDNYGGTIPRKQIKRRPLPSDPFTGEAPAGPAPDLAPTPPRAGGPRGPKEMSAPSPTASELSLSGSRPMPKGPKQQQPAQIPTQSPLQTIEYNTSPTPDAWSSQQDLHAQSPQAALPPAEVATQHTPRHERYDSPSSHHDERDYSPRYSSQEIVNQAHYRQGSEPPHDLLYLEDQRHASPAEDDRPPPPPAHRSRHNSGNSQDMVVRGAYDTPPKPANAMRQDVLRNEAHRASVSTAAYPGRPTYRGFDSAPAVTNALPAPEERHHEATPPRHHSYDAHAEYRSMQPTVEDVPESPNTVASNAQRRISRAPQYDEPSYRQDQIQPPPQQQHHQSTEMTRRRNSHTPQYDEMGYDQGYDQVPSPAPLNISGRGSASSSRQRGHSPQPSYGRGDEMGQGGRYSTSPRPEFQPRGDELVFAGRGAVSPGHYSTSPQPDYQQDYQPRGDELVLAGRGNVSPGHYTTGSNVSRPDPDEKIITHDGREIDPSDHLPMDTWAPEPEPKGPKTPATASVRSRASPAATQAMPPTGRRQLRIAGRPQSQASPVTYGSDPYHVPGTPPSGGRNRLQKKTQRMSAMPSTSPAGSSPLAPISSHNYQDHGSDFTPPRLPRASTWDYPSENHAPQYGNSPGGGYGGAPPIPAKVPLPIMSGANGDNEWALMQEMSRIDIGAGRSRRHRHY